MRFIRSHVDRNKKLCIDLLNGSTYSKTARDAGITPPMSKIIMWKMIRLVDLDLAQKSYDASNNKSYDLSILRNERNRLIDLIANLDKKHIVEEL